MRRGRPLIDARVIRSTPTIACTAEPVILHNGRVLLTITTTMTQATDLGYLLHKHPDRVTDFGQSFGNATVYFPRAEQDHCTAALLLDVDPLRLRRGVADDFSLGQYVNDRPYTASSLLAVAIGKVFGTARRGRCDQRQDLADGPIPLEIELPVVPCRGGADVARQLFEPLGWNVTATPIPLNVGIPSWGASRYLSLRLTGTVRLADALNHLYVLLPVLDDAKHYWIDIAEVDKLIRNGGDWLAGHPSRELITSRYLGNRGGLRRIAMARLAELSEEEFPEEVEEEAAASPPPLAVRRIEAVIEALKSVGAREVLDLGCGSGRLLSALMDEAAFTRIAGTDVSMHALRMAERRLRFDRMSQRQADRITLFQSALTYEDNRLAGYDAAILMEVIEHIDPSRIPAVEQVVFGSARPGVLVVTTPNVEYNRVYNMPEGALRHPDHRFEWDRARFEQWARSVAAEFGYRVDIAGIGDEDPTAGHPTQIGVFTRD